MKHWTVKEMLAESPCGNYSESRLVELWAGRTTVTLLDIAAMPIPPRDVMCCAFRPGALTPVQRGELLERIVRRANATADDAVLTHCRECGVPAVEAWAERWLSGEDRSVAAAYVAADDAAYVYAVAYASYAAADADAEYAAQVRDLLAVLKGEK